MPSYERIFVAQYAGLDLNTAKIRMADGGAQISRNFDYRRGGAARLRPGFARTRGTNVAVAYTEQFSDDFESYTIGNTLIASGTDWAAGSGDISDYDIVAGKRISLVLDSKAARIFAHSSVGADPITLDNHYAQVSVMEYSADATSGPLVRGGTSARCYALDIDAVGGTARVAIIRFDGNTPTALTETRSAGAASNGDVWRIDAIGADILAYKNGVFIVKARDGSYKGSTYRWAGVQSQTSVGGGGTADLDNFSCGDIEVSNGGIVLDDEASALYVFERDDGIVKFVAANGTSLHAFDLATPEWTA